jgi:integrase
MRVFKRGRTWWIDYTFDGERIRESAHTESKRKAERLLAKRTAAVFEGRYNFRDTKKSPTFSDYAEEYMRGYSRMNKKPLSYRRDQVSVKSLTRFFGKYRLNHIEPMLVEHFKRRRTEIDKRTRATVNRELALMKHIYTIAVRNKRAATNPLRDVRLFREDNEIVNPITDRDEERLLENAAPHLRDLIVCGVDSGLRRQEIFELTWDRVDLTRRTIRVENTKTGKPRTVPITNRLMRVFRRLKETSKSEYVFTNPSTGGPLTRIDTAWRRANERAGLKHKGYRFHDCRGTFCTRLVEAGQSIITIKQLSGHTTTRMLERYAKPGEASRREAIEALDRRRVKSVVDFKRRSG